MRTDRADQEMQDSVPLIVRVVFELIERDRRIRTGPGTDVENGETGLVSGTKFGEECDFFGILDGVGNHAPVSEFLEDFRSLLTPNQDPGSRKGTSRAREPQNDLLGGHREAMGDDAAADEGTSGFVGVELLDSRYRVLEALEEACGLHGKWIGEKGG